MTMKAKFALAAFAGLLAVVPTVGTGAGGVAWAQDVERATRASRQHNKNLAGKQEKVDSLHENKLDLRAEYRATLEEIDSLEVYNRQVAELTGAQDEEIASLEAQVEKATSFGRSLTPLMIRMIDNLEAFVELDVPFLQKERAERLEKLRELMNRSDVAESEKYRRILEAYEVEMEYGRTIEAYRGQLDAGGKTRTVNFLRIGRVVLAYQTLDDREAGVWNQNEGTWEVLDARFRSALDRGIRIAQKQTAPDLIQLPVPPPVDGEKEAFGKPPAVREEAPEPAPVEDEAAETEEEQQ